MYDSCDWGLSNVGAVVYCGFKYRTPYKYKWKVNVVIQTGLWTDRAGISINLANGPYTVTVKVMDTVRNCDTTLQVNFVRNCSGTVSVYNVNLLGKNSILFPNPALDVVEVKNVSNTTVIRLLNMQGQEIGVDRIGNSINVQHLVNGIYYVAVLNDGVTEVHKLVVTH